VLIVSLFSPTRQHRNASWRCAFGYERFGAVVDDPNVERNVVVVVGVVGVVAA
jgi:hypothetical protein